MSRDDLGGTLADVLERVLDKGLVINADITVSVVGVELLGIKLRAALASFETAARYGLEFPMGVNFEAPAWRKLGREACPPYRWATEGAHADGHTAPLGETIGLG